jgi:hypothetical protein
MNSEETKQTAAQAHDARIAGEKIRYRVDKISEDLEKLSIEEHGTIVNVLSQMLEFRVMQFRKAKEEAAEAAKAAAEEKRTQAAREAMFGLNPAQRPA